MYLISLKTYGNFKSKAPSVKLVEGHLTENLGKVEAAFCYACRSPFKPKLVATGLGIYKIHSFTHVKAAHT